MAPVKTEVVYEPALADAVAERGIYVCPTIGAGERIRQRQQREGTFSPQQQRVRELRLESLAGLHRAGVTIVSGNDAGMGSVGFDDFQLDLELLVEHLGLTPVEAIQTATVHAAEAIGSDEFGSLAPGKRADVLAVRGDAAADIGALRHPLMVLKSGATMLDTTPLSA
jgi:imidazolonepropionase-like amidohydrolase